MRNTYVVGIAGGTCSGKSTLVDRLAARLADYPVAVLHMDRYFRSPAPHTIAPITRKEYVEHNHPDTLDLPALYRDFDAALQAPGIVLIEGLFALYLDPIRDRLDLKVFVDLQSDERIVRRIKRFLSMGQSMDEITDRYLDTVRFRHNELIEPSRWHADLVLNGTLDAHKGAEVLLNYILAQVQP